MKHSLSVFSFVKALPDGTVLIWHVNPTGDWEADYKKGQTYGQDFVAKMKTRSPGLLGQIARAMPREFTAVEYGFWEAVNRNLVQAA